MDALVIVVVSEDGIQFEFMLPVEDGTSPEILFAAPEREPREVGEYLT